MAQQMATALEARSCGRRGSFMGSVRPLLARRAVLPRAVPRALGARAAVMGPIAPNTTIAADAKNGNGRAHNSGTFDSVVNGLDCAPKQDEGCVMVPHKTHIVCTLGPSARTKEQIVALLNSGMRVARFNFSHGSHVYHRETLDNLRAACLEMNAICAVLLDTKGPEIRTGMLKDGKSVLLREGSTVTLVTDYAVLGDDTTLAMSYPYLAEDVKPGKIILLADGSISLEVMATDKVKGTVTCKCLNTATLGERKNCNLPGVTVRLPTLTDQDRLDLAWGVENNIDFVAASFVRKATDLDEIRACLGDVGRGIRIISKIENQEGLANFDAILESSDGIMVARGDLGMEIPLEKMFYVQKMMIKKCNMEGKPVVTATQMLDSMINNPRPTRAEATDVANAVLDGSDCVMLSGETASGKYPTQAVQMMASICSEAEKCVDNFNIAEDLVAETLKAGPMTVIESLASSAVLTAAKTDAKLIVVLATNGFAARLIAKYRPNVPVIVGVVPRGELREVIGFMSRHDDEMRIARQCNLTRGLIPMITMAKNANLNKENPAAAAKECVLDAIRYAKALGYVKAGDQCVTMHNVESQCAVIRVMPCPDDD